MPAHTQAAKLPLRQYIGGLAMSAVLWSALILMVWAST